MGNICRANQGQMLDLMSFPEPFDNDDPNQTNQRDIPRRVSTDQAAVVIQAHYRGFKARNKLKEQLVQIEQVSSSLESSPTQHYPRTDVAVKLNQTPTDYVLTVQKALYRLGPFRYNDYIGSDDLSKQSKNYQMTAEDKKLPFLEPHELIDIGAIYIGQWKDGKKWGKGKQIWPDGSVYEGFWRDNKACGIGRLIHQNGDIYIGDWLDDKCHGYGVYTHVDGTIYKGEWQQDQQCGMGCELFPDGSLYKGEFENNMKCGHGEFFWPDKSHYVGQFKNNLINGQGKYVWPDMKSYEGEWKDNKMHGKGVFRWPDGREYRGQYINDLKHGDGEFQFDENMTYKGQWFEGKQNGEGLLITKEYTRAGIWSEGKRLYWK